MTPCARRSDRVVVCAPTAFKGTLGAVEVAAAMAEGASSVPRVVARAVPVADGGDGTLDVLCAAAGSWGWIETHAVSGPLGDGVDARLGWMDEVTAIVELAEAAGLRRLSPAAYDPLRASSRGAGELLRAALDGGAKEVIVGVGGSASTDGGAGLLAALGIRFLDRSGQPLPDGGGTLLDLDRIETAGLHPAVSSTRILVACDVAIPLLGPRGAAAVFGPQKGADPTAVARLEAGLARLAEVAERTCGVSPHLRSLPGSGAAGGAAWGLAAFCGASLQPGAPLVVDRVGLDALLDGADLVLTGEGRLDATTWEGKAPLEVASRAQRRRLPCIALCGEVAVPPRPPFSAAVAVRDWASPPPGRRPHGPAAATSAAVAVRDWASRLRPAPPPDPTSDAAAALVAATETLVAAWVDGTLDLDRQRRLSRRR